jgi:hypothetical protein
MTIFNLTKEKMKAFCKPLVYLFVDRLEIIYIGSSKKGISRPLCGYHHVPQAALDCTNMLIIPCETYLDALNLENSLIELHQPKYNRRYTQSPYRQGCEKPNKNEVTPIIKGDEIKELIEMSSSLVSRRKQLPTPAKNPEEE